MIYSAKQHLFLVVFELSGANGVVHEIVLYWEQTDIQSVNTKGTSVKGSSFLSAFELLVFFLLLIFSLILQVEMQLFWALVKTTMLF